LLKLFYSNRVKSLAVHGKHGILLLQNLLLCETLGNS